MSTSVDSVLNMKKRAPLYVVYDAKLYQVPDIYVAGLR